MVDYRKLRLSNLKSQEFRHLWLLLYWPLYGFLFWFVELDFHNAVYMPVWLPLDDRIPFCEWFMIPYMFWFVFLVGMHIYLLLFDVQGFRRFMYFIMVTYTIAIVTYLIWPTSQELRPESFPRDNFLTRFVQEFYRFDTNTNVCPSIHVIGSVAVGIAAWNTPRLKKPLWRTLFMGMALLISISTVFVKQHSIIDVYVAFLVCLIGWFAVYGYPKLVRKCGFGL